MIEEQTSKTNIPELARELLHLPFDQVAPSDTNPRLSVDKEPFDELKKSIHANGLLQPIVVRPRGDVYEIIGGHRRFQAIRELAQEHPKDKRFTRVAVVVVDVDDAMVPVLQLAENLNRSDLSAVEVADGIARAVSSGLKASQLADNLGKSKRQLNRYLQLAKAPEWFREYAKEVKVLQKKLDTHGAVVIDEKTQKPVMEVERFPGLAFGDLSELITLYDLLREHDAIQLEELGGDAFKPQAEKTTKRLAMACASEGWGRRKLRDEVRKAKDPHPRRNEPAAQLRPAIVVTADRCVIDLEAAAALTGSARKEFAAQLTAVLLRIGFTHVVIEP